MIKGAEQELRFPRIGKIKIGYKHEQKGYPISVDYFIPQGRYAELFKQTFGDKPNKIDIVFPINDINTVVDNSYSYYKQSGLYCKGDGIEAHRVNNESVMVPVECPCEHLGQECQETTRLTFMIPKIPAIGVWQLTTRSRNTRINFVSILKFVQNMAGRIDGVPFILSVQYEESGLAGQKHKFPIVTLTPRAQMQQLLNAGDKTSNQLLRQLTAEQPSESSEQQQQAQSTADDNELELEAFDDSENEDIDPETEAMTALKNLKNIPDKTRVTLRKFIKQDPQKEIVRIAAIKALQETKREIEKEERVGLARQIMSQDINVDELKILIKKLNMQDDLN